MTKKKPTKRSTQHEPKPAINAPPDEVLSISGQPDSIRTKEEHNFIDKMSSVDYGRTVDSEKPSVRKK